MKAIKVLIAFTLLVSVLAMPTMASDFVPSRERGEEIDVVSYEQDATKELDEYLALYIHGGNIEVFSADGYKIQYDVPEELQKIIKDSTGKAYSNLKDISLGQLVMDFENKWKAVTEGAPVENAVVVKLFDLSLVDEETDSFINGEKIKFKFKVEGIGPNDDFLIIHKPTASGNWIVEDYTIDENGVITMTVDSLSPFAIVMDNGAAPTPGKDSPQTGVTESSYTIEAISAVLLIAGAVVIGKKLKKSTVQ